MMSYGYKLMSEEHGPRDLVRNACRAEQAGFEDVADLEALGAKVEAFACDITRVAAILCSGMLAVAYFQFH